MTLRVLFATRHVHFPQGGGGGERNTHELCLALARHDVEPAVMCSLVPDGSWLSWNNRLRRKLPPRRRFPVDSQCGYPVFRGWIEAGAKEVVARFRPDIVVVQATHPDPLLSDFTPLGRPLAVYFHEVEEIDHLAVLKSKGPAIFANSEFTSKRLFDRCGLVSKIVLPIVDPRAYVTETSRERVLFVNTVPRKGVEIAFALAEARPDIKFDFVRSWILKEPEITRLHRRAEAAGNIEVHAPVQDMRPLYARARLVLAPSLWEETWGRVATEAHINGIPVLGSDRGGLPQAIGPGGRVVAANAPVDVWVAALGDLWDHDEVYRDASEAARTYSKRHEISPDAIALDFRSELVKLASAANGESDFA